MQQKWANCTASWGNGHLKTTVPKDIHAKGKRSGTQVIYTLTRKHDWLWHWLWFFPYFMSCQICLKWWLTVVQCQSLFNFILFRFTIKNSYRVLETCHLHTNWTYQTTALFSWFVFRFQVAKGTKKALIVIYNFLSLAKSSHRKSTERQISWAGNDWLFLHKSADRISGCTDHRYLWWPMSC